LSAERVKIGGRKTATVTVAYTVPEAGRTNVCHVRANPGGWLRIFDVLDGDRQGRRGARHAAVALPLVLKP